MTTPKPKVTELVKVTWVADEKGRWIAEIQLFKPSNISAIKIVLTEEMEVLIAGSSPIDLSHDSFAAVSSIGSGKPLKVATNRCLVAARYGRVSTSRNTEVDVSGDSSLVYKDLLGLNASLRSGEAVIKSGDVLIQQADRLIIGDETSSSSPIHYGIKLRNNTHLQIKGGEKGQVTVSFSGIEVKAEANGTAQVTPLSSE